jgi:hypothetical protein
VGQPILVYRYGYARMVLPIECTCRMAKTTSWLKLKLDLRTYHCGLASVVQVGTYDSIGYDIRFITEYDVISTRI